MKILIIGAGGHGLVIYDIFSRMKELARTPYSIAFLDDNPGMVGKALLGCRVEGTTSDIDKIGHDGVIVAIGDNRTRRGIFLSMEFRGERYISAIHPSAIIASDVEIGQGAMICAGSVVNPGSVVGNNVILNTGCTVDHHSKIHDHVHIAPGVHMGGNVEVKEGTLIGIGSSVLPGIKIGLWCVIGAGSVVTKDIPDNSLAFGVPATLKKK